VASPNAVVFFSEPRHAPSLCRIPRAGIPAKREANYASLRWLKGSVIRMQSLRRQAELGRLLSAAAGYRVVAGDGTHLGWLDHVRYEQHADRPDEIVVRRRGLLLKRHRAFPFSRVETVRPRERTVVLGLDRVTLERSPSA
jgi:hypothetical protein